MNGRLLIFLTPFLLIACGEWSQAAEAQEAVAEQLDDPASAEFRDVKMVTAADGKKYVCGGVNGKKQSGSYGGFQNFVYSIGTTEVLLDSTEMVITPGRETAKS